MYYMRQFIEALLYPLRALLTSPGKVTSSARRLAAISLPARISILVAMFLVFVVVAIYFAFLRVDVSASFFRRPREWIAANCHRHRHPDRVVLRVAAMARGRGLALSGYRLCLERRAGRAARSRTGLGIHSAVL